jgi:hypothetical protein
VESLLNGHYLVGVVFVAGVLLQACFSVGFWIFWLLWKAAFGCCEFWLGC